MIPPRKPALIAGYGVEAVEGSDGTSLKVRTPQQENVEFVGSPPPFDASGLHFYCQATGPDSVVVQNMRVYGELPQINSGLNFYDDEDETLTGFDVGTTYYLYVEATNSDSGYDATHDPVSAEAFDPDGVYIPPGGSYYILGGWAGNDYAPGTLKELTPPTSDEIQIVMYDTPQESDTSNARWLIAEVEKTSPDSNPIIRQKHLGAIFLPDRTVSFEPVYLSFDQD